MSVYITDERKGLLHILSSVSVDFLSKAFSGVLLQRGLVAALYCLTWCRMTLLLSLRAASGQVS